MPLKVQGMAGTAPTGENATMAGADMSLWWDEAQMSDDGGIAGASWQNRAAESKAQDRQEQEPSASKKNNSISKRIGAALHLHAQVGPVVTAQTGVQAKAPALAAVQLANKFAELECHDQGPVCEGPELGHQDAEEMLKLWKPQSDMLHAMTQNTCSKPTLPLNCTSTTGQRRQPRWGPQPPSPPTEAI